MPLECWFCRQPAATVGFGFAVCDDPPGSPLPCSKRAYEAVRSPVTGIRPAPQRTEQED